MQQESKWEVWLAAADSAHVLAPDGYDDDVALARVRTLHERVSQGLSEYSVKTCSPALYQDSTGLAHCRIGPANDGAAAGWIVLSHFGDLATVHGCTDPQLLAKVLELLADLQLKYIDYEYLTSHTYDGECRSLRGRSWANRYFALEVDLHYEI